MSGIDPRRYLLTETDSERIFREEIVPRELSSAQAVDAPCVVFVAGQPGAGKTKTTEAVVASFAGVGGAVVVNSDFYKPHHPMYDQLLVADDVTAAPYTSLDGRRWMAKAEAWLIEHRRNVVIETTMRDPGDFLDPAKMFREHGYAVEAVVMAVPAPLSRLGILARYAEQVRDAGAGRLTETSNHDASYTGVRDALTAVEDGRLVDVVSIWRRGNHLLYANQLDTAGQWAAPTRAVDVLDAERQRTFTYPEASAALAAHTAARQSLGQAWAPQLTEIDQLLQPQLPAGARAAAAAAATFPRLADPLTRTTSPAKPAPRQPGRPATSSVSPPALGR